MRQPPEFFGDAELDLVYLAKKLDEALKIEALLDQEEIDYLVEPDRYKGGVIFQTERIGAFFYVDAEQSSGVRVKIAKAGYKPYESEESNY